MDKVVTLNEILAQDPANAFARYGLAMEYASRGELDTSVAEFNRLLELSPDYIPGYFMAAKTLAQAGREEDAKDRLRQGIANARQKGDHHALSEMQAMLDDLEI